MLDRDLIVCEPWCGEECVTSGPTGKSWDFATARHWCSPECRDNRRRMHEGEGPPCATQHEKCEGCRGALCEDPEDGCTQPAPKYDAERIPFCPKCYGELVAESGVPACVRFVSRRADRGQDYGDDRDGPCMACARLRGEHGTAPAPAVEGEPPVHQMTGEGDCKASCNGPPIPAAEAIRGLVEALATWKCDRCSGRGWNLPRVNKYIVVTGEHIKCDICDGAGKHPVARAALAAFERRALDALRAFDGDKLPLRFVAASAWETAHSAEAAIPALKCLLAAALTDVGAALKELRATPPTPEREPGR